MMLLSILRTVEVFTAALMAGVVFFGCLFFWAVGLGALMSAHWRHEAERRFEGEE